MSCDSTEPIPMTERHKAIIAKHLEKLVNNVNTDPILIKLVASGTFTMAEERTIQAERTPEKRARELLFLLVTKQDKGFYDFTGACEENNMGHLAKLLSNDGNKCSCVHVSACFS